MLLKRFPFVTEDTDQPTNAIGLGWHILFDIMPYSENVYTGPRTLQDQPKTDHLVPV